MTVHVEICVLGAGPAGATLAGRLAGLGHRVALVEQSTFPRPHVGESVSRAVWPLLDQVDVARAELLAGGVAVTESAVRWRAAEERLPVVDGTTVDRATFDAALMAAARAAGATVLTPVRAGRPVRAAEGWRIPLGAMALQADVVADASGRRRLLGGRRAWTGARTLAVHARWPASSSCGAPQTVVDTLPEGWLWAARLAGGDVRVMAFVDPATLAADAGGPMHLLRRLVCASSLLGGYVDVDRPGRVAVCDASSYVVDRPIGPDHVRVGEAAFAIDPLSSCGVQTAVRDGLAAAAAVHTALTPGGDLPAALEYYTELHRATAAHHRTTAARLYADHQRFADEPFWSRRRAGAPATPSTPLGPPSPAADLLGHRVRLRAPATVLDTPCLVGDLVVRRPALHHPDLERPAAFLGGVEVGPLLRELPAAPSLVAAMRQWERILPAGRGAQIVGWLLGHGLLERAS